MLITDIPIEINANGRERIIIEPGISFMIPCNTSR